MDENTVYSIKGKSPFIWKKFSYSAEDFTLSQSYVSIPGSWNSFIRNNQSLPGQGYGSYYLKILVSEETPSLVAAFKEEGTSVRVLINGRFVKEIGKVGEDKLTQVPHTIPFSVNLPPGITEYSFIFHIANFYYRKGGMWNQPVIGDQQAILKYIRSTRDSQMFILGSLLILFLYNIALYFFNRQEKATLVFSILCIILALRTATTDYRVLADVFPFLPFGIYSRLEFFGWFGAVLVGMRYLVLIFPNIISNREQNIIYVSYSFLCLTLVLPPEYYSHSVFPSQFFFSYFVFLALKIAFVSVKHNLDGSNLYSFGLVFFFSLIINDILHSSEVIRTAYLSGFGILTTVLIQGVLHSKRLFFALQEREQLNRTMRLELEKQVSERTQELTRAKEKAEKANEMQKEFLANMSHEIRTPLNGILGIAEILSRESELEDTQIRLLNTLKKSGENLLVLLNDILDYSKIEFGKMNIEIRNFYLSEEIEEIYDLFETLAKEKGLIFQIVPGRIEINPVKGDAVRFKQILWNITNNAIKFTDRGKVEIYYTSTIEGDSVLVRVNISDTGPGISRQQQSRLFQKFSQVDSSRTKTHRGSGLGLAISYKLAELMNGKIFLESEINEGSVFSLEIKFAKQDITFEPVNEVLEPIKAANKKNLRILVAEDDSTNRLVIEKSLEILGYFPKIVNNGKELINEVNNAKYDLILTDIYMPEVDGLTAAQEIMQNPSIYPKPLIVAITANILKGDTDEYLKAGISDWLSKPIQMKELEKLIRNCENFQ